ncbi:hypothetical protein BGW41_003343, partial [Actinomortierella wolfii]
MVAIVATAQTNLSAPRPSSGMAYAKYKNKFYINGGTVKEGKGIETATGQFFALDLSKPWRSDSPAWIPLPEGPKKQLISVAMSLDGKVFMTFPEVGFPAYRFSFEKNAWSATKANFRDSMYDVDPVTLGTDGTALIFGGSRGDEYDIYSFETDQTVTMNIPPELLVNATVLPKRLSYRAVWSESLKSAVFYGGNSPYEYHDIVSFYHPESKQWSSMRTTGLNKTLIGHCIAISQTEPYGGPLNVSTVIDLGKPSTPVMIYSISQNGWVEEYQPSAEYLNLDPSPSSGSSPSTTPTSPTSPTTLSGQESRSKLSIGGVAGGTAAAAVVLTA